MPNLKHPDSELIDKLGGTTAVAKLCEVQPPSVSAWRNSGIPKAQLKFLKLARPDVFGTDRRKSVSRNVGRRSTDLKSSP